MNIRNLFILIFFLASFYASAQVLGDYRSNATPMNWNATASWQRWNGTSWVSNPAEGYPGQNASGIAGTVTIQNGHTVTINVSPADSIGNLTLLGNSILAFNNNANTVNASGDLIMDGTSQITGNNNNRFLYIDGTFTIPATATNARISGIRLTIGDATTVTGTLTLNSNTGNKTFTKRVIVTGSWTSTAINANNRLVFGAEVITSGVFACGCN